MDFFTKVKRLCSEKKVSLSRMANDIGISRSNPANWEKGATPQIETIGKLADYFGVPISYFTEANLVEAQTIHDNHGIIGSTHAPVTIINGSEHKLSEQAVELLNIFEHLSIVNQAKLLVYAESLKEI